MVPLGSSAVGGWIRGLLILDLPFETPLHRDLRRLERIARPSSKMARPELTLVSSPCKECRAWDPHPPQGGPTCRLTRISTSGGPWSRDPHPRKVARPMLPKLGPSIAAASIVPRTRQLLLPTTMDANGTRRSRATGNSCQQQCMQARCAEALPVAAPASHDGCKRHAKVLRRR